MKDELNKAIALMKQAEFLGEQVTCADELRKRLSGRELVISVIGQFKRGKSSLINALLGDELLPVGIVPLTTAVTEIRKGDSFRAIVSFNDGSKREIKRNDLSAYISEQKNHNNKKDVAIVELWTPRTPFESGITLVDTPGVGSVHQHNTETSYGYIEKSDAVLFLLSVDSPVSEVERDFLLKVREFAAKFYFAINKADIVSENDLNEFISYCKAVLYEIIDLDVTLHAISSKTGEGISSLVGKLVGDLRSSHDRLLEESISIKLETIIEQAKAKLNLYLKAAAFPADELKTSLTQIRKKQSKLIAFSDEVEILIERQTEQLVECIREQLDLKIAKLQPDIESEAERLRNKLSVLPSRQFKMKLFTELESIMHDNLTMLNAEGLAALDKGYTIIANAINEKAEEMTEFISNLVKDQFDMEYPASVKEFFISKRNDFYIRVSKSSKFFLDTDVFTHLLPRGRANKKIYERGMKQMFEDIARNKNNMVYNYSYKMRESLRTMCSELAADICRMRADLNELLVQVEECHKIESRELRQIKVRFTSLIRQLDALNINRKNNDFGPPKHNANTE